jgi:iron complex outermembrane receptor protein
VKKKTLAALMTSAAFAGVASAQESENELTEVVVSAQRRDESIQRVPISVQALVAATLEQHQVQNFDDYTKLLPSVSFQSLGPGKSQLFYRGVTSGSDGDALSAQPTAGVYLDEIPVTTIGGLLDVHIYDVERVEALSGPQGTLFGANSLSGTLRIITNKPDPTAFKAGYDLELNKFAKGKEGGAGEAFVNVPLSDNMALRAVGFYQRIGGYIDNTLTSRTYQRPHALADGTVVNSPLTVDNSRAVGDDFNSVDTYGGRLALGIKLDDNWTVTPSVTAQRQTGHGSFLTDPKAGDLKVHDFIRGGADDKWYQASLAVQGRISNWDLVYSGGYMKRENILTQDYSYYTVAYDEFPDYTYFQNTNGTPLDPTQFERYDLTFTKQTHEVRLSSPTGERFNFTAGLFYQDQTNHYRSDFYIPGLAGTVQAPSWIVAGESIYRSDAHRVDRDYAAFAQADYHITPSLTLTGGIRGYKYENSVVGFSGFHSTAVSFGCVPFTSSCVSLDKSADGSGETHKASLAWQITSDHMVYATYSTGFRPGGINRRVNVEPYGEDKLSNYEIGWKTSWLDHRLRVNGAAYHERWSGIQYGVIGFLGAVNFINAGDADIDGMELDAQLKLGGFLFSASGAYNDAKLATPFCTTINGVRRCDLGIAAPKGTRLPVQPRFKSALTARYEFNAGASNPFLQVSMTNQTDATSRLRVNENDILGNTPGFSTVDIAGGFTLNSINFQLFMQNAFDKRGELSRNAYCLSLLCYENYRSYPAKPQLIGVKMSQRF